MGLCKRFERRESLTSGEFNVGRVLRRESLTSVEFNVGRV